MLLHIFLCHPASLSYCDPSCCPPATFAITILKLPPYRADYNMADQADVNDNTTTASDDGREVTTAADLAKLRNDGKPLTPQELKELSAKIKALEEMARLEDRLRALENRKRPRSEPSQSALPPENPTVGLQQSTRDSRHSSSRQDRPPTIQPSIELDNSDSNSSSSSSNSVTYHRHKRQRITRGIKITPSYILKVSSSLREWGDWKKDMERVFEGDPYTYQKGSQKILKALDYMDSSLKSLWYTYNDQQKGIRKWLTFLSWTRDNIQNGQNTTAMLYEQLNSAKQLPEKSPVQFNAYLSAIERDLPQQDEKASAMMFYSKLTRELKRQFKTSDIPIPETRAKCVAVAQRVWEGLHGSEERKGPENYKGSKEKDDSSQKYPRTGSKRDRKDQYHLSHRHKDDGNKEKRKSILEKEVIYFKCNKPGHYAPDCPDRKESTKRAKIQSTREDHSQSRTSSRSGSPSSSRSSSKAPETPTSDSDSSDSLN